MTSADQVATPTLQRTLGLWQVTLSGIGIILGAGVYALVGPAAGLAGSALWLAFLLAGITAAFTAYPYARLVKMRPKNAPEFQYTSLAFGPRAGFVAGWLNLATYLLGAAAVALGFGGYLGHLLGTPALLNAYLLLIAVGAVAYTSIAKSVGLAGALALVEAGGLLFVIVVGAPFWRYSSFLEMPGGMAGVWSTASLVFFAYIGFGQMGNFAEEMRQPERDLPRALFLALAATALIYILVAVSAVAAVGWRDLSASQAPLALVAERALGDRADAFLSYVALAATSNTVLLLIVAGARTIYAMAAAGVLPEQLSRISSGGTPAVATALVLGVTAALVLLNDLAQVAAFTNAAMLLSLLLVNVSMLRIGFAGRLGDSSRATTADRVIPLLALASCSWLLLLTGWQSLTVAAALAGVGAGLALRSQPRALEESQVDAPTKGA